MPTHHRLFAAPFAAIYTASGSLRRIMGGNNDHAIRNAQAHHRTRQDAYSQVAALERRVQTVS